MSTEDPERRARLARTLAALEAEAGPASPEGRTLAVPTDEAMLDTLLDEIDRTVLGRELHLKHPDGTALRLEAGNRRLLGFAAPIPDRVTSLVARLPQTGLSYAGAGDLAELRAIFLTFRADADTLTLRMARLERSVPPDESGASVATLRQAFATATGAAEPIQPGAPDDVLADAEPSAPPAPSTPAPDAAGFTEVLPAILTELQDEADAVFSLDAAGKETVTGDAEAAEELRIALDAAEPSLEAAGGDPACLLLSTGGGTLLIAAQGAERLVMLLPESSTTAAAEAWRTLAG